MVDTCSHRKYQGCSFSGTVSVERFFNCDSATAVQDTVTSLYRCLVRGNGGKKNRAPPLPAPGPTFVLGHEALQVCSRD